MKYSETSCYEAKTGNKFYIILLGVLALLGVSFAAKKVYDAVHDE